MGIGSVQLVSIPSKVLITAATAFVHKVGDKAQLHNRSELRNLLK